MRLDNIDRVSIIELNTDKDSIITEHADGAEWAPHVVPAVAAANALLPGT